MVDASDTYNIAGLPDLDLRVFYKGLPIASSSSLFENVEHLHFPVWNAGNPLDYEIHVSYPNMFADANLGGLRSRMVDHRHSGTGLVRDVKFRWLFPGRLFADVSVKSHELGCDCTSA